MKLPKIEERFIKERKWTGYYYWDTPDGKDCFKKLWFATKYSAATGLVMSFYDICLLSHPKGYFQGLARVAYFTVPAVAVGTTLSALAFTLTQVRQKDDGWNYLISGYAAGSIWGAARQNVGVGFRMGALVAFLAVWAKISHQEGWNLFNVATMPYEHGVYNQYTWDWSLLKDPRDKKT